MDSFESLMALLLERKGYWVRTSFKVELSKNEKIAIGRPSSPRWEIDLVAYKGAQNEVLAIECKSYLDSPGVRISGFMGNDERAKSRYKLFNNDKLRKIVLGNMVKQLIDDGACAPNPDVSLCLVAGKFASENDRIQTETLFKRNGWGLYTDEWLIGQLEALSKTGYDNQIATVVSKLILRNCQYNIAIR